MDEDLPATPNALSDASRRRPIPAFEAKVLRGFFEGNRLVSIPAQEKKRLVVLRHLLVRCFPEDRPYPEKEVNQRLAAFHPDVASLRRYLVVHGLVTRAAGVYRRVPHSSGEALDDGLEAIDSRE
jgi:hypothetical protein